MLLSPSRLRGLGSRVPPCSSFRPFTAAAAAAASPTSKPQVYLSRSRNPYLNLSVEHHLLQTTPPDSTVLFLYTNRPCVVIGRNQNPWLEVNLPLLSSLTARTKPGDHEPAPTTIDLVRRRSGGGTVFHDPGNVNYSVICPPESFDRDKHAEMVVRALRGLGVPGARVNARHDIVVDVDVDVDVSESDGNHGANTFKISGSAYKLTRLRSLHHGTCLLSSPNLGSIGPLLRSPAEPFIKARGVESVRSPVRNVGVGNGEFEDAVVAEFAKMYGDPDVFCEVGDEAGAVDGVEKGMKELLSRDWIYGQTPLFSFSTYPTEDDPRERPSLPSDFHLSFEARHGQLSKFTFVNASSAGHVDIPSSSSSSPLDGSRIYDVEDWTDALRSYGGTVNSQAETAGRWLNGLFGTGHAKTQLR
ncbi:putative lipoate-protein ligase A [Sodiomyces alkalinus F11]|uniref:Putative lipoate-protein ligase A n=1 Tax=Sodiomyces alkalinus (strain CBS 110278 / VKM F-3762 / F11) TaxID=1314773 RepID=A0A3N2PKW3_SODAK|nr:putative lipoate-protein ligase A [Sodiomyces alkalinus F11]ROT35171.1 putative lipoate-protein ligase A [Sodiomyces alkalinus F11]